MTIPLSVLKVKDVKGGASVDLLSTFYWADEPAWSPSGDKIAFSALDPKTTIKTIWLTTIDGKKLERVTDGPYDEHPAWHPDGTDSKILFARRAARPTKDKKTSAGIYFLELTSGKTVEFYQSDDESYGFPQVFRPKGKTTTK
jgi:Tol biopolymer transport system component